jgi:hypothetical protein
MLLTLARSLGLAYASGISPYATVTLVGLMQRAHWIAPLPSPLGTLAHPVVLGIAGTLAVVEFVSTLVPGVAAMWDALHTAIRPPAAALLAVLSAWHADPGVIAIAGLLGGGLGLATHATKLGLRLAVDASPEPVTNGAMNLVEWGIIGAMSYFVWNHPVASLIAAMALLVLTMLLVRLVWRTLRRLLTTPWRITESSLG